MGAGISTESKSPNYISQVESANEATDNDEELSYYLLSNTTSNVRDPAETWSPEKVHELLSPAKANQAFFKGQDPVLDMMSNVKLTIIPQQKSSEEQTKTNSGIMEQKMKLKSE